MYNSGGGKIVLYNANNLIKPYSTQERCTKIPIGVVRIFVQQITEVLQQESKLYKTTM